MEEKRSIVAFKLGKPNFQELVFQYIKTHGHCTLEAFGITLVI
jgi:hypothetical protein